MFTNQTKNLGLPQWEENDTPSWADDVNNAFEKIDETYETLKTDGNTNQTQIEALTQTQTNQSNQIKDLQEASGNNTAQLAQIKAQVDVNTAHLADVDANIKETDKTVADNKTAVDAEIETINNTVDDLSATVATLENEHNTQQTDIDNLKTNTETNAQNIQSLQTSNVQRDADINKNKADIAELQTEQQELSGEVAGFSADITQNTADITAIKTKNTQQDTSINNLTVKTDQMQMTLASVGNNASSALETANQVMGFFPLHFSTASLSDNIGITVAKGSGNTMAITITNALHRLLVLSFTGTLTTSTTITENNFYGELITPASSAGSGIALSESITFLKTADTTLNATHFKILVFPNSANFIINFTAWSKSNGSLLVISAVNTFRLDKSKCIEIVTEKATEVR